MAWTRPDPREGHIGIRNLEALLHPRSIAVVGASNREHSVGGVLFRNLLRGGYDGIISPINPKYESVQGVRAHAHVRDLDPEARPELGVVCTPPDVVPLVIDELGEAGARAAVVITAGLRDVAGARGATYETGMLEAARRHGMRILGPNCVGFLAPGAGLNCSFAHTDARPGRLAFLSQSGGLTTAVLDWAGSRGIGFSYFISLGNSLDVDAADLLDFLSADPDTRGILLYLESVGRARAFMSAARAASRTKHVLLIKAGRVREGARAAASHTGALAGSDDVYEAAIGRAGMLRVFEIEEIFDAVETLGLADPPAGGRLVIVSNGGGPAVMATDALVAGGGRLAALADDTHARLDALLPPTWSRANPVDIIGDASAERYGQALDAVLEDPGVDAVLVLHSPVALVSGEAVARAVVEAVAARARSSRVLTCWLGGSGADAGRAIVRSAGLPTYLTPEHAARAFLHLVRYRANQARLMETPTYLVHPRADRRRVRERIEEALAGGREWLSEPESKQVLGAYGVPIVESRVARSPGEALELAAGIGYPVALKVLSPDLVHKSDVGGVALDLDDPEAITRAWGDMSTRLRRLHPDARLDGFLVQRMSRRPRAHELIVGATTDPVFGPVILFGQGGTGVEVIADRAVELPPLNSSLAARLVDRTRVARLLAGYRDRPAADRAAIVETLVSISRLVTDFPHIVELDVNPLLADETGVVALDARIRVRPTDLGAGEQLAIRPYPRELEESLRLPDGRDVRLRPIRPEDEPAHLELFRRLKPEDVRFRFFGSVRRMPHGSLARYTQIDYDREMAFIASTGTHPGDGETLGVVRVVEEPEARRAEFAIVVRADEKGHGLGEALMRKVIRYCEGRGTKLLVGQVMAANRPMLRLAAKLGFVADPVPGEAVAEVRLTLPRPAATPPPPGTA